MKSLQFTGKAIDGEGCCQTMTNDIHQCHRQAAAVRALPDADEVSADLFVGFIDVLEPHRTFHGLREEAFVNFSGPDQFAAESLYLSSE